MKTTKMYAVKPEWLYGDEREEKLAKQVEILESLGLKQVESGFVVCNADSVIRLLKAGYCGSYNQLDQVEEIGEFEAGPDVEGLFEILADKLSKVTSNSFNDKCQQHQPNQSLMSIAETKLLEDSCTDVLQENLANGWRILAIQPQPDQRRPDYILGRPQMSAIRG